MDFEIAEIHGRRRKGVDEEGRSFLTQGRVLVVRLPTGETTAIPHRRSPDGNLVISVDDLRKLGLSPDQVRSALRRGKIKIVKK